MTQRLLRSLFVCAVLAVPAGAGTVQVVVRCRPEPQCKPNGALLFRAASGGDDVRRVPLENANAVLAGQNAGSEWDVMLDAPGFWAPPLRITVPSADVTRTEALEAWLTGTVQVRVRAAEPPISLEVGATSAPQRRPTTVVPERSIFRCVRGRSAVWNCEVPATDLDLAFKTEGHAPHYAWDVKVKPRGVADLGTVTLKKGASFVAWLEPDTAKQLTRPAHATLRRRTAADPSPNANRLATPVAAASFNAKGMVQLAPLAAGHYILETQAEGFAPSRVPVEVAEARESMLRRPIELARPVTARFRFDPPQAPDGTQWQLKMWRNVEFGTGWEVAGGGAVPPDGVFEAPDQAEGTVRLVVQDADRNILARREIVLSRGVSDYSVAIDTITISGDVLLGEERLQHAKLLFGGAGGAEKVRAAADEQGHFQVLLPRRGSWIVEVEAADEDVFASTKVEVPADADRVDVKLPDTEVSGWVVGTNGERLSSAEVLLLLPNSARSRRTDNAGNFAFRGVAGGTIRLQATKAVTKEASTMTEVVVPSAGKVSNVGLTIEGLRTVAGILRANGQPLAGARVNGYAFAAGAAQQERATTDIKGAFTLNAPESASSMILVVGAPGLPLQTFTVAVPQESAVLDLAVRGGSLDLRVPAEARPVRIFHNDAFLPFGDVVDWSRVQGVTRSGDALHIPNVAAGRYQLCSSQRCVEGTLAAGGNLELSLGGS